MRATAADVLKIPFITPAFDHSIHTHAEARSLFRRACDLKARFFCNRVALEEYEAGNLEGSAILNHAEVYLADRLGYQLAPAMQRGER